MVTTTRLQHLINTISLVQYPCLMYVWPHKSFWSWGLQNAHYFRLYKNGFPTLLADHVIYGYNITTENGSTINNNSTTNSHTQHHTRPYSPITHCSVMHEGWYYASSPTLATLHEVMWHHMIYTQTNKLTLQCTTATWLGSESSHDFIDLQMLLTSWLLKCQATQHSPW